MCPGEEAAVIEIFKLFGSILIDNDEANKSISATEKRADGLSSKLVAGAKTAAKWGAGIAAGAAAAGGALFGLATRTADVAGEIADAAVRAGVTTEALQEMRFAAEQSGVSTSNFDRALERLTQRIGRASDGNKTYTEALERLGFTQEEIASGQLTTEEAFNRSIHALSQMESQTDRAAAAGELFGTRLGRQLLPIIEGGVEDFTALRNRAQELGIVLSTDAVEAGSQFGDSLDQIKGTLSGIVSQIGVSVMPMFQTFFDFLLRNIPKVGPVFEFMGKVVGIVFGAIKQVVGPAVDWIRTSVIDPFLGWIVRAWENNHAFLADVIRRNWDIIKTIFSTAFDVLSNVWQAFKVAFSGDWESAWQHIKDAASAAWNALPVVFESSMNLVRDVADRIMTAIIGLIRTMFGDTMADIFQAAWDTVIIIFETAKDTVLGILATFTELFKGNWEGAWQEVQDIFSRIWSGIEQIVEGPLSGVISFVRTQLHTLKNLFLNLYDGTVGLVSQMVERIREWLGPKLEAVIGPIQRFADGVTSVFAKLSDVLVGNSIVPDMTEAIKDAWIEMWLKIHAADGAGMAEAESAWENYAAGLSETNDSIVEDAKSTTDDLMTTWKGAVQSISSSVQSGFQSMYSVMEQGEGVWAGVKAGVKEMVIGIIDALQQQVIAVEVAETAKALAQAPLSLGATLSAIPGIVAAVAPAITALEGAKAIIRALADGGRIIGEGLALVGERGPELVNLPSGASVLPLDNGAIGEALASIIRPGPSPLGGGMDPALAGVGGYSTANIIVELDGRQVVRAIGEPLADEIRAKTGIKL